MKPSALWRSLRPKQWTKNAHVLAALFFALGDPHQHTAGAARVHALHALFAVALFCLASSGIYLLNDARDVEQVARMRHHAVRGVTTIDRDAERPGSRLHHRDGLRVAVVGHEEAVALAAGGGVGQVHGLGHRGRLVEQRGVGERQAGQVRDHGLEVEQRLQPALRDLRLVRRVGGVPAGVLQDVAQDDAGRHAAVVAHPQVGAEHLVAGSQGLQVVKRLLLAAGRGQAQLGAPDVPGHGGLGEGVERVEAQGLEHGADLVFAGSEVPAREAVAGIEEAHGAPTARLRSARLAQGRVLPPGCGWEVWTSVTEDVWPAGLLVTSTRWPRRPRRPPRPSGWPARRVLRASP